MPSLACSGRRAMARSSIALVSTRSGAIRTSRPARPAASISAGSKPAAPELLDRRGRRLVLAGDRGDQLVQLGLVSRRARPRATPAGRSSRRGRSRRHASSCVEHGVGEAGVDARAVGANRRRAPCDGPRRAAPPLPAAVPAWKVSSDAVSEAATRSREVVGDEPSVGRGRARVRAHLELELGGADRAGLLDRECRGAFVAVVRGRAPCEERHVPRRCGARRCGVEGDAAADHAPASRLPQHEAVADVDHERVVGAHPHEQRAVGQPVEHADPGGGLGGAVMHGGTPRARGSRRRPGPVG